MGNPSHVVGVATFDLPAMFHVKNEHPQLYVTPA